MERIAYTSNEYVLVPLKEWSGSVADPTTLPVKVAVIAPGADPAPADFVTAAWVTVDGLPHATVLWQTAVTSAQPHTVYAAWMQITSTPEVPVLYSGVIKTY